MVVQSWTGCRMQHKSDIQARKAEQSAPAKAIHYDAKDAWAAYVARLFGVALLLFLVCPNLWGCLPILWTRVGRMFYLSCCNQWCCLLLYPRLSEPLGISSHLRIPDTFFYFIAGSSDVPCPASLRQKRRYCAQGRRLAERAYLVF